MIQHSAVAHFFSLSIVIALATAFTPAVSTVAPPKAFSTCAVCHRTVAEAPPAIGSNLWRIGGRTSGTLPAFAYSQAMKAAKIRWTRKELISFVTDPRKRVPGTRMIYAGQKDPEQAAAIADYLMSLK
jgi:cytochrome c